MAITGLRLDNFTVFEKIDLHFVEGINIFIGENGTGKTHIMKILYSACQTVREDIIFSHKLVKVFKPDGSSIKRLITKNKINCVSRVMVSSKKAELEAEFSDSTKKWHAIANDESNWEERNKGLISTYIPAKDILTNAYQFESAYVKNVIDFDETYLDIIAAAKIDVSKEKIPLKRKKYLDMIKKITLGNVLIENEKFYLNSVNEAKVEFQLIAEGWRKLALLWKLIQNGTLEKGTILFWDEPEANINPIAIPILVEILLELQKEGVQIFISTHDYILAKYFEVKARKEHNIAYYSLFKDKNGYVKHEKCSNFRKLKENPIIKAFDALMEEVLDKNLGD